jgi:hypothetical protein
MVIRICTAPGASWFVDTVTIHCIGTAMSDDAWRLFRQMLRRKHDLGFQCNLVLYMLTIKGLAHIPLLLSHTVPPDYTVIV